MMSEVGAGAGAGAGDQGLGQVQQVYLVEKCNFVLKTAKLPTSLVSLIQLRSVAPLLFVKVYHALYGPILGIISDPQTFEHHVNNIKIFLSAMRERFSVQFLDKISAIQIVQGNIHALEVVVDMLFGVCQHMAAAAATQEIRVRPYNNNCDDERGSQEDFRKVKDTANNLKSNKVIKKYYSNQKKEVKKNIPADIKVLMDRLIVLEQMNQESSPSKKVEKAKTKKKRTKKIGKGRKSHLNLTPLFAGRVPGLYSEANEKRLCEKRHDEGPRKTSTPCIIAEADSMDLLNEPEEQDKQERTTQHQMNEEDFDNMDLLYESEKQDEQECTTKHEPCDNSFDNMDLLYESEKQDKQERMTQPEMHEEDFDNMDLLYESEKQEDGKPEHKNMHQRECLSSQQKQPQHEVETYEHADRDEDEESEGSANHRTLVPILSRGKLINFEAPYEKDSYHYHRPAMCPSSRPLPSQPSRPRSAPSSTRRRSPTARRVQWQHAPQKNEGQDGVAEGRTEEGVVYVYDTRTGRKVTAQEMVAIQQARDEKYQEFKHRLDMENAPPVVPAVPRYPNHTTEASVRLFLQKMAISRLPSPTSSPHTSVIGGAQYTFLDIYRFLESGDIVISVENCCNCEFHQTSLRHNAEEYVTKANTCLKEITQLIHELAPLARVGVFRFDAKVSAKSRSKDTNSRVGAFEIQIAYCDEAGQVQAAMLHSKLTCARWPSSSVLEKRLHAFLAKLNLTYRNTKQQCDLAGGKKEKEKEKEDGEEDNGVDSEMCSVPSWSDLYIATADWVYAPEGIQPISWIFDWRVDNDDKEEEFEGDDGWTASRSHNIAMDKPHPDSDYKDDEEEDDVS